MSNMMKSLYNIRLLDELAQKRTAVHNAHPLSKLLVTAAYLVAVVSCGKYELNTLLPFFFYPAVIMAVAEIPVMPILKRALIAAPLAIAIGIFNPLFDSNTLMVVGNVKVSGGWISFFTIFIKSMLTVIAALILIATTQMTQIAYALRIMRVPRIFVMQLLLTYRYISVLMEEVSRTTRAYSLRSPFQKGIKFGDWGSLSGQLLIRTVDRAERIYQSMCCRGFEGEYNTGNDPKPAPKDVIYGIAWVSFFIIARFLNLSSLIGLLITGGAK